MFICIVLNFSFNSKQDLKGNYDPSESEEEYTPREKQLLEKVRRRNNSSSGDEEVYGFSESEDEKADVADSDVEGQEGSEDDLPDVKAWGKKKRAFYSTDYVDEDFGGFGKDEEAATLEEQEALSLQRKLAERLGDEDFSLEFFTTKTGKDTKKDAEDEIIIKSDLSQMSKRQKIQLLEKESPEFPGLVNDFKEKLSIAQNTLKPIIALSKNGGLPDCTAIDFIRIYYELILNYCTNISFYLLLKTKKIPIQNHPVTKRLYQHRQMLNQIEPVYEERIQSQIDKILSAVENNEKIYIVGDKVNSAGKPNKSISHSKKLKLLSTLNNTNEDLSEDEENIDEEYGDEDNSNESSEDEEIDESVSDQKTGNYIEDDSHDMNKIDSAKESIPIDESGEKRAITYQMAKNRGLTPRRKKEQRNPRVKHRNKYRKAKIRRKGAIREPRTETTRYAGEISGIKANVKKSIKIK